MNLQPPKRWLPWVLLLAMEGAFLLLKAVLPLRGIWYHASLQLASVGLWILEPTQILFPGRALTPTLYGIFNAPPPSRLSGWLSTALLFLAICLLFFVYFLSIRFLSRCVSPGYILAGSLLLGITCMLIPVVSSADVFSYIIYARMQVLYHLNPLVTTPLHIQHDPLFIQVYWTDQPSAYGPTWILLSSLFQWLCFFFGFRGPTVMVFSLRLLGLFTHFGSALLVWLISGHLLKHTGKSYSKYRIQALLAFAWNPLLLFEACTNAHNDTVMLFFILLALWFLLRHSSYHFLPLRTALLVALMLALATCLKINVLLLLPGFLLFFWRRPQRFSLLATFLLTYALSIALLYAPFWDGRSTLAILHVNPSTYRNINTLVDFLCHFYNSIAERLGFPSGSEIGSPAEQVTHLFSITFFVLGYFSLCGYALFYKPLLTPLRLLRWLAISWLLYCFLGTPWFWPWYLVTFFGLYALIDASSEGHTSLHLPLLGEIRLPLAVYLLSFSMFSLYCFYTYVPFATLVPKLPHFRWAHLRGLWAWLIPLLALKSLPSPTQKAKNLPNTPSL